MAMKTIIQTIGPLIGEAVNGTVFGQPNGSVAVPPYNALVLKSANPDYAYIKDNSGGAISCESDGTISSNGEYLSYEVVCQLPLEEVRFKTEISDSSDFSTIKSSGLRKISGRMGCFITPAQSGGAFITAGTTYYVRCSLVTLDGSLIVMGATYEVEGVVV